MKEILLLGLVEKAFLSKVGSNPALGILGGSITVCKLHVNK